MSTRSYIGKKSHDGTIEVVYCHSDGYPSHQTPRLANYKTEDSVDEILELGAMSLLGPIIGKKHQPKDRDSDVQCCFYMRDWNGVYSDCKKIQFPSLESFIETTCDSDIEYAYLFDAVSQEWMEPIDF